MVKPSKGTLYIVACAAGPAKYIGHLVTEAISRGWIVRVLPTPNAMDWLPLDELEQQTGFTLRPVVSSSLPAARKAPPPDAIIVAPASFNTINKLALGISDNKALDTISPLISTKIPFVILPFTNQRYYARAPLRRSVSALRREGVSVLLRPPPNDTNIWESALALLERSPKGTPRGFHYQGSITYVGGQASVHTRLEQVKG